RYRRARGGITWPHPMEHEAQPDECDQRELVEEQMRHHGTTYALQVVHGRLFGMGQSKANQWIHVLLPVLLAALRTLGGAPARSLTALAQRLGVAEAAAATVVAPLEEEPAPIPAPDSPLVPMMAPNGASSAPRTLLNRPRVRAARKKT